MFQYFQITTDYFDCLQKSELSPIPPSGTIPVQLSLR